MEFKNYDNIYIGIVCALFWVAGFWYILKKPQLYLPTKYTRGSLGLQRLILFFVGVTAWYFLTFAIMGPRKPLGYAKDSIEVNDIFIVVDVSRSMLAEDFQPNRLEAAKRKILEFIGLKPTDRIGVIMFSEKAYTLLPLSTDLELIRQIVAEIKVGFLGSGTNIGDALGLAVARGAQSIAKNKIIVLLTDGVSNVGTMTPIQAAEQAKEKGIKIYSIGVGGSKDARIPIGRGVFGKRYQTIPGGSIDIPTLEKIAKITNGKSYIAQDEGALKDVLKNIGKLERTEIKTSGHIIYDELYLKYLIYGVMLLLLTELGRKTWVREGA